MSTAGHFVLLAVAVVALGSAACRLVGSITEALDERLLGAGVIAVTIANVTAMGLGVVGAGSSAVALTAAAVGTAGVAHLVTPAPDRPMREQVARWWETVPGSSRLWLGAVAGATAAWGAWLLRHPVLGTDGVHYHLAAVADWVSSGRPGSLDPHVYFFPVEAYPQATEVLMTWACGIARSPVPWHPIMVCHLGILAVGVRSAARALGATGLMSSMAAAVMVTLPMTIYQLHGPHTDLPSLAWLAATAALALRTRARPGVACLVIMSAGLAVGMKTTVAPIAIGLTVVAIWSVRGHLRRAWPSLVLAVGAAGIVGGFWYLRNWVLHGSPLWPFVDLPVGDRPPTLFRQIDGTFLGHLRQTLSGRTDLYAEALAGGLVLLVVMLILPVLSRDRPTRVVAMISAASLLMWMNAPFTGDNGRASWGTVVITTTRYLLPTLGVAALVHARAGRGGRGVHRVAVAALGLAIAANLAQIVNLDDKPYPPREQPHLVWLALGAIVGAALCWSIRSIRQTERRGVWAVMAGVSVTGLAVVAPNYMLRHAQTGTFDGEALRYLLSQPAYSTSSRPLAFAPATISSFAGDRFEHPISLLPEDVSCGVVRSAVSEGWVILGGQFPFGAYRDQFSADECLEGTEPILETASGIRVYGEAGAG